jgi:hypothetical protein
MQGEKVQWCQRRPQTGESVPIQEWRNKGARQTDRQVNVSDPIWRFFAAEYTSKSPAGGFFKDVF